MSLLDTILFYIIHFLDKLWVWHRLPVFMGLAYLAIRRHLQQRYNLLHVGGINGQKYDMGEFSYRTADGSCNHPNDDQIGSQGTFFGRNIPPSTSPCGVELEAPDEVGDGCPLKSFKFFKSKKIPTGSPNNIKTGHLNTRTPWWDGSVIYGNNKEGMGRVRTFKDGKLKISEEDGLLEHDDNGIPISGDVRNCWAGFSLLQALFVKEHNAVCDMLKENYGDFDDEKLYRHARLVTSALIAKIHTIDCTVELLKTPTLLAAMRANWLPMEELVGKGGERRLAKIGMEQMVVSMGHQACGANTLWNYPSWMRDLVPRDINGEDRTDPVDLAALERGWKQIVSSQPILKQKATQRKDWKGLKRQRH